MHEGSLLISDEFFEFGVKGREVGVMLYGVERGVVAMIPLIFPYMDCTVSPKIRPIIPFKDKDSYQKCHSPQLLSASCRLGSHGSLVIARPLGTTLPPTSHIHPLYSA